FAVTGDPNAPSFEVPNIGLKDGQQSGRLRGRVELRKQLDQLRRDVDRSDLMRAMDVYETQALDLLTSTTAARAFDLNHEPAPVRDRYGRNQWGQQCLLARRLVEAGVDIVTTTFDGPLCG